ncbi:MAG: hypothetical protein M1530_00930 [Candidatus Marsarchaeota archaeon]|nr:hypothetical protein [Candidatus Marsarchaeota archaeon]
MRFRLLSAFLLLTPLLLLSGCLQPASVDRCIGNPDREGCLTFYATWYQEPETCYSIESLTARQSCLEAATDPIASMRLQQSYAAYGRAPPSTKPAAKPPAANASANTTPTAPLAPITPPPSNDLISKCMAASPAMTVDSCAKQLAVSNRDLSLCTLIVSPDMRSSCILAVATSTKDPTACQIFNLTSDRQFCLYYARGA